MGDFPIGFGRYSLVERLAVGGMAELFVATSPGEHGFQKKVVIKRLLPHLNDDATYNAMFIDEAKLTARLVHPKIAQTFELGKVDNALYIAMEHVDGIDVLALLREFAARKRRVDPQLAVWIAHEVLDALDYAHHLPDEQGRAMGVVHRDISPSNVLLSVRGDVKLVDFGIARAKDPGRAHKSKSGTLKGKYGYMSPEQVQEAAVDGRSDVFSVGVVLAELLTGRRLFAAPNELDVLLMVRDAKLSRLDKYGMDIEPALNELVRKALRKPVDERWQSAAAFREALAEWLFDHRHRMSNKQVADVVHDLREAVAARRGGLADAQPTALVEDADKARAAAAPRAPSETDGAPVMSLDVGDSMPVISVSYEVDISGGHRAISVSDLAASAQAAIAQSVAITAPPPSVARGSDPGVAVIPPAPPRPAPVAEELALPRTQTSSEPAIVHDRAPPDRPALPRTITPMPPRAAPSATPVPRTATFERRPGDPSPFRGVDELEDGSVEIPIGDTISAAVEAIMDPIDGSVELVDVAAPGGRSEDSVMRSFDDVTEAEGKRSDVPLPSAEEISRKRPPTPPALADIAEPPDDAGDFATTSPLRVMFRLMTARATGLLVVAVGGIKKDIYVRDGQPEYVSSNVASELFGNYLVTKGVLSDGELAMALAMMPHYGGKLGDTLVGLGLLKPLEVFRHLTRQVRSKIIDVCTWNKGSFGWYAGRENPREAFPLDFNAFEILGAGAMALAEDVIEAWIAKNSQLRLRAARTRRVGPERFEVKGLPEMFESLDGRRSVGDYVELHHDRADRARVGRMLCLLEACDLAKAS